MIAVRGWLDLDPTKEHSRRPILGYDHLFLKWLSRSTRSEMIEFHSKFGMHQQTDLVEFWTIQYIVLNCFVDAAENRSFNFLSLLRQRQYSITRSDSTFIWRSFTRSRVTLWQNHTYNAARQSHAGGPCGPRGRSRKKSCARRSTELLVLTSS